MKRLLTYLSAIIIMMMVPIGVSAWTSIYLRGGSYDWNNNSSGSEFKKWDDNNFVKAVTPSTTGDYYFRYYVNNDGGFQCGPDDDANDWLLTVNGPDLTATKGKATKAFYFAATAGETYYISVRYVSSTWKVSVSNKPIVRIGGCIGGQNYSWDNDKAAYMAYDSTEDAWYYDVSASDFSSWKRSGEGLIGLDFRFREVNGEQLYYVFSTGSENNAHTTLTSTYQELASNTIGADSRFVGVEEVANATNYRVWYKNDNGTRKAKVEVTTSAPVTTTATLTIGGTNITGSNSGSNYYFDIPADKYTAGSPMEFTLKTVTGGTATYYTGNFTGTASGDAFKYTTSTSEGTMSYSVPSDATGLIRVSLLTGTNEVVFAYTPSGGGGISTGYYLVGDLNAFGRPYNDVDWDGKNWGNYGAINKVLKFKDNGNGTYSLRIPAAHPAENENEWDKPSKEKQDVSHEFVIAPESAFSGTEYSGDLYTVGDDNAWKTVWEQLSLDWSKVLRPTTNNVLNNAATNGNMAASGSANWEAKMNGGSYTITINPTAGTWSVTNDNLTHVMYVITKQDGYWRASYLTDVTTGDDQAYDHNHGNKSGELSEFPNESGSTVYVAHNWYEHGSNKKFSTKEHLTIFGAWNTNGDLAPVTWINATSGATAKSIFPTAGRYSTVMDPTLGTTGDVTQNSQKIITNDNEPSIGNITGKKGNDALISPDATLNPGTEGGNYDFDDYETGIAKTLTVTLSNANKYAYAIGANSSVTLDESSTETDGSFTLTYDGTKVTDGFGNEVTGNTVYVKIQGQDDADNKGTTHTYQYTFNVPVVSTLDFTPKGGFFINKAVITVTNGTAPYTYTIKDASDKVLSTGTSSSATFTISTPGYLTVEDSNSGTKTSDKAFDFTYSTSENYANYYNNGTTAQSVAQEGGKDATNIFLKKADYKNMRIYAWDDTYDQLIQKYQKGETTTIDSELSALGLTHSSESNWKDIWENDKFIRSEQGTGDGYTHTYNDTRAGFLERDPYVMLTEPYPGTLMSDSRSIEIDGEEYYYLTLPLKRLHFTNSEVGIIVTRNDDNPDDLGKNADKYKTADYVISSNSSFIYSSVSNGDDTYTNRIYDISELVEPKGNIIFFDKAHSTSASSWSQVYCYAWKNGNDSQRNADWPGVLMADYGNGMYIEEVDPTLYDRIQFNNGSDAGKTPNIDDFGSGKYVYTYVGTKVNKTKKEVNQDRYTTFIKTPATYTVEVQNHPNGDDYLRAMPSDKTVLLDPTWGGVITPKQIGDEETSVDNWNGVKDQVAGYRKFVKQDLTQTIYGLDKDKTYTVQAIVRVWSNEGAKVSLKVGDGEAVTSKNYGASSISHVNKNGRVDEKYTQGPDLDDPYFIHYDTYGLQGFGWQKIEATGKPTAAGNLVITLTFDKGTSTQYDLSDVVLLEEANTAGHYWTKLPTDANSVAAIKAGEIDMQDRSTYNAFSFFDRDSGNPNAIIKASNRTVIGLNSGIAYVQNSSNENVLDDVDHRQSRNTISLNEGSTTDWSGRYLYLYDESSNWSDCNAYGASVNFKMIGAKYDRQFTSNQHSTMFLPFAVTTEQLKTAGFKELQMVDVDNVTSAKIPLITWDLTKTPYTTIAGQGYIVIAGGAGASLSSFIKPTGGIEVQAANSALAKKTEATGLVGAYVYCKRNQTEDAGGTTYMNYSYLNDKFRALATAAQGGAEIKPFRATFAVPMSVAGGARMLSTFIIDADEVFTPTGVDKLGVEEQLSGNIYTLDGRLVSTNGKLSELSRGIYVRGGRKIVVK